MREWLNSSFDLLGSSSTEFDQRKRNTLKAMGATAGAAVTGGCLDEVQDAINGGENDEQDYVHTPTPEPEPRLETQNATVEGWIHELFEKDSMNEVEQMEQVEVIEPSVKLTEVEPDQATLKINGEEKQLDENGEYHPNIEELDRQNTVTVQHDPTGNEATKNLSIQGPESYVVNRTRLTPEGEKVNISSHPDFDNKHTPIVHDQHVFNVQEFQDKRQEWLEDQAYTDLGPLNMEEYSRAGVGFMSMEDIKEEPYMEKLRELATAVQNRNDENSEYHGSPSAGHQEMASTMEMILNEETEHQVKSGSMGTVGERGGHGMMIMYREDAEQNESRWHMVNTTGRGVMSVPDGHSMGGLFTPWTDYGNDNDKDIGINLSYRREKELAQIGLISFASIELDEEESEALNSSTPFFTDEWLESAYDHIRDNGKIDPIQNPIEEWYNMRIDNGMQDGEGVTTIYGDSLEDTKIGYSESDEMKELREKANSPDYRVTTEEINQALEQPAT